jgi:hypothetical protein
MGQEDPLTQAQKYFFPKILSDVDSVLEVNPYFEPYEDVFAKINSKVHYEIFSDYRELKESFSRYDLIYSREFCHFENWMFFFHQAIRLARKYILVDLTLTDKETIIDKKRCSYLINDKNMALTLLNREEVDNFFDKEYPQYSVEKMVYNISSSEVDYPYEMKNIFKGALLVSKV